MMRFFILMVMVVLSFGCIGGEGQVNDTVADTGEGDGAAGNGTPQVNDTLEGNQTVDGAGNQSAQANATPSVWESHSNGQFRFQYPKNMETDAGAGLFTGTHALDGTTGEILVVMHYDASKVHGTNQAQEFRERPSQAATTLLMEDMDEDPIHMLDSAQEVGDISEFSVGRDTYVSQVPFKVKFDNFINTYEGYALSMYSPERSLHIKVRIIALDPGKADDILDQFLLSYSLE
jgi:hypothetical protein